MATTVSAADSYCRTDMQVGSRTFVWSIKNFNFSIKRQGKQIYSPEFSSGSNSDHVWHVHLYPNGNSNKSINNVSMFLHLLNSCQDKIVVQYKFCILNDKGQVGYVGAWSNITLFYPGNSHGIPIYVSRDHLFINNQTLLPKNILTISCEIKSSIGFTSSLTENNSKFNTCLLSSWMNYFHSLFQCEKYSDVTLILKSGKKLFAHKCILAIRSSVFATLMDEHAAKENALHIVNVNDFDDEIIIEMLRFIYGGSIQNLQLIGTSIMAAAVRYDVKELKEKCEEILIKGLSIDNAANLLITADLHKLEQLKASTIQFMALNLKNVITTSSYLSISNSHPHLLNELLNVKVTTKGNNNNKRRRNSDLLSFHYFKDYFDKCYEDDDNDIHNSLEIINNL